MTVKKAKEKKSLKTKIKSDKKSKTTEKVAKPTIQKATIKKTDIETKIKENEFPTEITIKRRISGHVPEVYHFYLKDGRKIRSVHELINALEDMSEDLFSFHVNNEKNDFANWISDVIKDEVLAEELRTARNKMETEVKLLKHVVKKILD